MAARWMVLFYTPAYAIAVRGWSPASAGSILIPTNLGFAIGGISVGGLHIRRAGSFWLYVLTSFYLRRLSSLTRKQTKHRLLFPVCLYACDTLADHQPGYSSTALPTERLHEWHLRWSSARVYTCSPPAFDANRNTFHLHFPSDYFPRFRWLFWLSHRRRIFRSCPESDT